MKKTLAALFGEKLQVDTAFGENELCFLRQHCHLHVPAITSENLDFFLDKLADIEVIFSTWTMPILEARHLDKMPMLKAVFFAGGSVKHFAGPLLDRGITVVSGWKVNAIPTAEFAFAQILLAMKGAARNQREFRSPDMLWKAYRGPGCYDERVALLGMGAVGRHVAGMLKQTALNVIACDPFVSREEARSLGVELVELEEAFARAFVVSNHIPSLPETRGILTGSLFRSMRNNAVFINTARGDIVDESGLINALEERSDLLAILDVTHPEPPAKNSPLFTLANVELTSHIAGAVNNEVRRLTQAVLSEFLHWKTNGLTKYSVLPEMVSTMA